MTKYWRIFNFVVRRVVAVAFAVGGLVITLANISAVLPGGHIGFNGIPSTDLVLRWAAVVLPLVVAALGVALYRVRPFTPGWTNG